MTTDVGTLEITETDIAPYEDTNDGKNHLTHIVNPPANTHIWQPGMEMKQVVFLARLNNLELTALCGHKWVPKRNPEKYDICQDCVTLAGELMRGAGE